MTAKKSQIGSARYTAAVLSSKKSGTVYSIALLPIGGFVAMEGEDGREADENGNISDDPNSFDKKPAWQRFIITFAGAFVNIFAGFIAMIVLAAIINLGDTTVHSFIDTETTGFEISSADSGLREGDTVLSVDGKRVPTLDHLSYEMKGRAVHKKCGISPCAC